MFLERGACSVLASGLHGFSSVPAMGACVALCLSSSVPAMGACDGVGNVPAMAVCAAMVLCLRRAFTVISKTDCHPQLST